MPGQNAGTGSEPDRLEELRDLVVRPERKRLDRVEKRLDDPAERSREVAEVLPAAVEESRDQGKLDKAMAPIVEDAIRISVRKDARSFAEALFPVMGPAIRRAIADTVSRMVQSLNQAVENSLSAQGLKWRLEAWRTGRPFGEVVLLHSLVYRVEQVFLIHRETGLLLQHLAAENVTGQDGAMISGMLTAIQDFVHDSFGGGEETLDSFRVGELVVWVEAGSTAVLAAVIRGTPPESLKEVLQEALNSVLVGHGEELRKFDGDPALFEAVRPELTECLRAHYERRKARVPAAAWVAGAAILLAAAVWIFFTVRDNQRWNRYVDRLDSEPGVVVVDAGRRGSRFRVSGLLDPLAAAPSELMPGYGIRAARVDQAWESYEAADPEIVARRARILLEAPESVDFEVRDGVLHASGTAGHEWLVRVTDRARFVGGVERLDAGRVADNEMAALAGDIEKQTVLFPVGSTRPETGWRAPVNAVAGLFGQLVRLGREIGRGAGLELVGHADRSGEQGRNRELSLERATAVQERLVSMGIDSSLITIRGAGNAEPLCEERTEQDRARNRSVTFAVAFR